MKIIDLLNKIANDEEVPKKIKYSNKKYEFIGGAYEDEEGKDLCYYDDSCMAFLTDEVEIIEEEKKIPEKLHHCCKDTDNEDIKFLIKNINDFVDRYNEIIDYLKEKENK